MRLDRSKFIEWLRTKQPSEIVGEKHNCNSCPIAKFYCEVSGGWEVSIFEADGRYIIDRGYKKEMPPWASRFAFTVDGESNGYISAARALEIIEAQ